MAALSSGSMSASTEISTKEQVESSIDESQPPTVKKVSHITPGELSRPTNIQRICQKKSQVKAYPRAKKLEKLAVYSSCKV